jgi:hypothetical protein
MLASLALLGALGRFVPPAGAATNDGHTGTIQSTALYTPPDPAAGGGIAGRLALQSEPLLKVFALPTDDPRKVYKGEVRENGRAFAFAGLPTAKYDLVLLFAEQFYEGLTLTREPDTLTERDRQAIRQTVMASEPFFDTKEIHRCAGTTGREGKARCTLQNVRTREVTLQDGTVHPEIQIRSLRLALLEDVGSAGWHLVRTREIVRTEVIRAERKGVLPGRYSAKLGGIRVVETVKDLGQLTLP